MLFKLFALLGVKDSNLLKNYHYRDDALDLWDAVEDYVDDIIGEFYETDEVSERLKGSFKKMLICVRKPLSHFKNI